MAEADAKPALDVLTEDADPCCRRLWRRLAVGGVIATTEVFYCPTCHCEYRPRQEGPIRAWGYFGAAAVLQAARKA